MHKCLHGLAPKYLAELCVPVADVAGRRQLRSASRRVWIFLATCQTMVDVRSVSPVLMSGTHYLSISGNHGRPGRGKGVHLTPLDFDINFSHIITVTPRVEIQMHFWKGAKFAGSIGHPITKMLPASGGL